MSPELPYSPEMASLSHCLTMIPMDAAAKLLMRLENQSALSQTVHSSTEGGGARCKSGVCAALWSGGPDEEPRKCLEISWSVASTGSGGEGASNGYD